MAQPNLQQRKTLERDSQKNGDKLNLKGHDPGCQCSACSGKSNAISDILQGQVVVDQKPKMAGHEAGCQCDSCSGKSSAINDLLNGTVKVDSTPKMAGHEPGCQCDSCSGKSSSIIDILKGNVAVDSSPKMAGHEPGCQCNSCSGKQNSINELLNGNVVVDKAPKMTGHEAGCQCEACGGKGNAIADIIKGNVILERAASQKEQNYQDIEKVSGGNIAKNILGNPGPVQLVRDAPGNYNPALVGAAQELISTRLGWQVGTLMYTEQSLKATAETNTSELRVKHIQGIKKSDVIANSKDAIVHDNREKEKNAKTELNTAFVDRKNYVVGNYTYEDILTTPWLRKLYGHLIGLSALEESSEQRKEHSLERTTDQKKKKAQDNEMKGDATLNPRPQVSNPKTNRTPQELEDSETESKVKLGRSHLASSFERKAEERLHKLNIKLKTAENLLKGYKDELKVLVKEKPRDFTPKLTKEIAIVKTRINKLKGSINTIKLQNNKKEKKELPENQRIKMPKNIVSVLNSIAAGKKKLPLKKLSRKELKTLEKILRQKKILILLLGPRAFRRKKGVLKTLLNLVRKLLS
jgi:hypothetical protein